MVAQTTKEESLAKNWQLVTGVLERGGGAWWLRHPCVCVCVCVEREMASFSTVVGHGSA